MSRTKALAAGVDISNCLRTIAIRPTAAARDLAIHEAFEVRRHFGCLHIAATPELIGDVLGNVACPAFSRVEADNADRVRILAVKQIGMIVSRSVPSALVSRDARPCFPKSSTTKYAL